MQKTKKVKRQTKGGHGKKKRIFTMKHRGGYPGENAGKRISNFFRGNKPTTVTPAPPNPTDKLPYSISPSPIRSRPPLSSSTGEETWTDVPDKNSNSNSTVSDDFPIGSIAPLGPNQPNTEIPFGMDEIYGNDTNSVLPTQNNPMTKNQIMQTSPGSLLNSQDSSVTMSPMATQGSTIYSSIVPDSTSTNTRINSDKTYIVKYKLRDGIPQEKEVFVQDPVNKTYTRYQFYSSGTPTKCNEIENNMLGNYLNIPYNKDDCGVSLAPLGQTH